MEKWITQAWYGGVQWTWIFWPLMLLYRFVVKRKRAAYLLQPPVACGLPVVVVGNITAGGTGKTPVVQALVHALQSNGYRAAIVTRGYGGSLDQFPHLISKADSPAKVGDEPFMMFTAMSVPIVVDPKRARAAQYCAQQLDVDLVICDDGLQHYALARDIEICVVDAQREFGNGQLIPVGPLREPLTRLNAVDYVLRNGEPTQAVKANSAPLSFQLAPVAWVNLKTQQRLAPTELAQGIKGQAVRSLAGIGNPQRFFNTVAQLGIQSETLAYPDHHAYSKDDFKDTSITYLMTQKDAIKVQPFAEQNMWYLEVSAQLPDAMLTAFLQQIAELTGRKHG